MAAASIGENSLALFIPLVTKLFVLVPPEPLSVAVGEETEMIEVGEVAPLGQCGQDGGWSVTPQKGRQPQLCCRRFEIPVLAGASSLCPLFLRRGPGTGEDRGKDGREGVSFCRKGDGLEAGEGRG